MTPDIPRPVFTIWTAFLFSFALLPLLAIGLDFSDQVAMAFGRTNNLTFLWAIIFIFFALPFIKFADSPGARRLLLFATLFFPFALLTTGLQTTSPLTSLPLVLAMLAAFLSGLTAYVLTLEGYDVPRRLALALLTAAIGLPVLPTLIAAWSDRYDHYMLHVYGFGNIRVVGYFAAGAIAILTGLATTRPGDRCRLLSPLAGFGFLTLAWTVLFWSGSRAGMAALVIGIPFALAVIGQGHWRMVLSSLMAMGLGALVSLALWSPSASFGLANRIEKTAAGLASGDVNAASSNRIDLWLWTIDRIREAPPWGEGFFPMVRFQTEQFQYFHSHNIMLEYLWGFGLVAGGLVLLVILFLYALALRSARRARRPETTALALLLTVLALYGQVSATLIFPYHLIVFGMALGCLLAVGALHRKRDPLLLR